MVADGVPDGRLIRSPVNLGFAAANNRGFAVAQGRYVVLLNSDAFMRPGALTRSVENMDGAPRAGLGGPRLVGRDDSGQPSARLFPSSTKDFRTVLGFAANFPRPTV